MAPSKSQQVMALSSITMIRSSVWNTTVRLAGFAVRLLAGNGGDAPAESSEQGKDDDHDFNEDNIEDKANTTTGGTMHNGVDGKIGKEGAEANDENDRVTDSISVTDDQLSGLYGRISAMRARDVEV